MAEWMETYRGVVNAWECDTVEHFTIAHYVERFASATRTLFELIGEDKILGPTVATNPRRIYTTFIQKLRAGAGFHMLSGVIGVDEGGATRQSGGRLGKRTDGVVGHGNSSAPSRP